MTSKYILIGIVIGVFFAGLSMGYALFINTYNPYALMMGNPTMFSQMMGKNPQFSGQYMGYMMQNPKYMNQWMSQNPQYMGQWMGVNDAGSSTKTADVQLHATKSRFHV